MIKVWWFIKCLFGFGSVKDGSICWFDSFTDICSVHDYQKEKGGDDVPSHFYTYECHKCGKKFEI